MWVDRERIYGGEQWDEQIADAIAECEVFIMALSPSSIESEHVKDEFNFALEEGKSIIPVIIKPVAIPRALRLRLGTRQRVDLTRASRIEDLIEALGGKNKDVSDRRRPGPQFVTTQDLRKRLEPRFDVPALLEMTIERIKETLGTPLSEFKPTEEQLELYPEMTSTLEYKKGTITLIIDVSVTGLVESIFISDSSAGTQMEDVYHAGNLDIDSTHYTIDPQNWANLALATRNKEPEIAGLHVRRGVQRKRMI